MGTKFSTFLKEIEDEARAEGPEAVEQLETFGAHFRMGRKLAEARRAQHLTQKEVAKRAKVDQAQISGTWNVALRTPRSLRSVQWRWPLGWRSI